MKNISFLIKPASSLCNLKCKYCFYADVSEHREIENNGIMSETVMSALIQEAFQQLDDKGIVTFAFQGGEPTVAGINYFKLFTQMVKAKQKKNQKVNYSIQTNATLLNDEWCLFLKQHDFLVGVSLDGYQENHDLFRITKNNQATYQQTMDAIELLRKYKINFNVLTVLSKQLAKNPQKLYEFYQNQKIDYIQLIPCLAGLDEEKNPFACTPKLFASFYKSFFDLWYQEYLCGKYRSIGLFDNLIPMFVDIPPYQCGMLGFCSLQYVVESDGSVYPCDFYVLDEYKGGNINEMSLNEIAESEPFQRFLHEDKAMSKKCDMCPFINLCRGNCKRMNTLYFDDNTCGYQEFLFDAASRMIQIAQSLQ